MPAEVIEPELVDWPVRQPFMAGYKLAIVAEYDSCAGDGDKGALLRREGRYSSHIGEWRRARDNGALSGASPRKRANPDAAALAKAKLRIEALEGDLAKHKLALEIAGKAHALLDSVANRSGW